MFIIEAIYIQKIIYFYYSKNLRSTKRGEAVDCYLQQNENSLKPAVSEKNQLLLSSSVAAELNKAFVWSRISVHNREAEQTEILQ